jgi:uroporphyrin-III C-methyltransferase
MLLNMPSNDFPSFVQGWVWLAGAGPGDPGLLTLHALNALGQADVVVYDALVSDAVLRLANPRAKLEFAGKRGGRPSSKQRDISQRLVDLARQNLRVLRLKGGDPLVFGRGGEEARALVAARVPFRIIPGISAGVGGLAYAGIPLTDRLTNSAVTFVTAHGSGEGLASGVDWDLLAKSTTPLVIYMALSRISQLAEVLMAGGRSPSESVAVISQATLPSQQVLETTLSRVVADVAAASLPAPCMMVVGNIVSLRSSLDWLGAQGGKTLDPDPLGQGLSEAG